MSRASLILSLTTLLVTSLDADAKAHRSHRRLLTKLSRRIQTMSEKLDILKNEVAGLRGGVDTLTDVVRTEALQGAAIVTKLNELKAQIAAGNGGVTEADLDALIAEVQGITQNLDSAVAQAATIVPENVDDAPTG